MENPYYWKNLPKTIARVIVKHPKIISALILTLPIILQAVSAPIVQAHIGHKGFDLRSGFNYYNS